MRKRVVVLNADVRATSAAALHHHPQYSFRTHCQCLLLRTEDHDVALLDTWTATPRATVTVRDNARIHHAAAFQARLAAWEDQNVCLFWLPT